MKDALRELLLLLVLYGAVAIVFLLVAAVVTDALFGVVLP